MTFRDAVIKWIGAINEIAVVVVGVGMLVLIIGILKYIGAGENAEERRKGTRLIFWGIIGMSVMISMWGLVNILVNTLDFPTSVTPDIPESFRI